MRGKHRAKRRSALSNVLRVIAVLILSAVLACATFVAMILAGLWYLQHR